MTEIRLSGPNTNAAHRMSVCKRCQPSVPWHSRGSVCTKWGAGGNPCRLHVQAQARLTQMLPRKWTEPIGLSVPLSGNPEERGQEARAGLQVKPGTPPPPG